MGRTGVGALRGQSSKQYRDGIRGSADRSGAAPRPVWAGLEALRPAFSLEALPLNALAFLIGRATVLQTLTPFGLAFYTAILALSPRRGLTVALAAALGILSGGTVEGSLEFLGAAIGLALLLNAFSRQARAGSPVTLAALAFTVTVVAGSTKAALIDPTPYQFLLVFFAALLTFVLTLVYLTALPPLLSARRPLVLGPEQVVAGAIAMATALAGLSGLGYGGLKISGITTGILILVAASVGGGGVGAAVGTVAGVISSLCGAGGLSSVGLWALSGLLAGSFRDFGKPGTAAGYFLGALLLSPLVEEALYLRGAVFESAVACAVFILLPAALLNPLRTALEKAIGGAPEDVAETTAHAHMGKRLIDFSHVFGQLASTLKELSTAGPVVDESRVQGAAIESLAAAACRVCQSCRLFRSCWKGDVDRTRGAMAGLLEITVERGQLEARDVPTAMRRRCVHLGELVTTMNFLHEISALNRHWRKKLDESRGVVYQQLDGLSAILRQLGEGLETEAAGDAGLAEELRRRLHRGGFAVTQVAATPVPDGKREFLIHADPCDAGEACRDTALPVASRLAGQDLVISDVRCGRVIGHPACSFRLATPRQLDFKLGVAQARKSPGAVSGDSYMLRELPGNRVAAVLSDGTGAGPRAAAESRATVRLLEELFRLGFDTEATVRTVNSMLLLRSAQERFATLDLLTVDLYDGQARFVKVGAPPSYLRRGRDVSVIHSATLPLGVLPEVSTEGCRQVLRPGDLIVMATDGLVAAGARPGTPSQDDSWIINLLREAGEAGTQEIADALVETAVSLSGTRLGAVSGGAPGLTGYRGLRDDVTVMTVRFGPQQGA